MPPWNCPVFDSSGLVKDHRNSGSTLLASGTASIAIAVASATASKSSTLTASGTASLSAITSSASASATEPGSWALSNGQAIWAIPEPTDIPSAFAARGLDEWTTHPVNTATPTLPSPWTSDESGFYFVENGGSNSGNGDPTDPRGTFPTGLSAGDVVVVSELGGNFSSASLNYDGTAGSFIHVVARNNSSKPVFTAGLDVSACTYCFIDGLAVQGALDTVYSVSGSNFVVTRNCYFRDTDTSTGSIIGCGVTTTNAYFYKNEVTAYASADEGDWPLSYEDHHGCKLRGQNIWWQENHMHHINGDCIQIATDGDANTDAENILIFGNDFHHTYQTGCWTKASLNLIVAHNTMHDTHSSGGGSQPIGLGGQYDFEWAYWIANEIWDCGGGIGIASGSSTTSNNWHVIGNIIRDGTGDFFSPTSGGGEFAISETSGTGGSQSYLYNTIYNYPGGMSSRRDGVVCVGNIVDDPDDATAPVTKGDHVFTEASITINYNGFIGSSAQTGGTMLGNTGNVTDTDAEFADAGNDDYELEDTSPFVAQVPNSAVSGVLDEFETRYGYSIDKYFDGTARESTSNMGACKTA